MKQKQTIQDVISLGAGVQSSTLLFLAAEGKITPKPVAAVIGDTQQEPRSVYRWLDFLLSQDFGFPILVRSYGDLGADNLRVIRSKRSGNLYTKSLIPIFIKNPNGGKGIFPRRCTRDYKIAVVQRAIRNEVLGRRSVTKKMIQAWEGETGSPVMIRTWIGISVDEADRMKPSNLPWIENRWPLVEMGISREDCKQICRESKFYPAMLEAGFIEPPRSACKQCPYHSDFEWARLKTEEPEDFQEAVEWERLYQISSDGIITGVPYLHSSLTPLDQVVFNPNDKNKNLFRNECEGMCGV